VPGVLGSKTRLLLGALLLAALVVGLSVMTESPATAQSTNTLSSRLQALLFAARYGLIELR
jgi:hypothetical protein